jgi:hypothetical protein
MPNLPLANGIIIDTKTGQAMAPRLSPDETVSRVKPKDVSRTIERARDTNNKVIRASIADLPADPSATTTAGVVWLYYMLGLNDADIAACTGLTMQQVDLIKGMKLFSQLDTMIIANSAKLSSANIETRIHSMAGKSMDTIEDIMNDDEVEAAVKLRAAQDLLDRAGHSSKQISEKRTLLEGGLVIRIVQDNSNDMHRVPEIVINKSGAVDVEESEG